MISNRCSRKSLVIKCNLIISENYLRFIVDSNESNYIVNDNYTRPTDIISQKDIFEKQQAKHIGRDCPLVSVLSAFPLFLQDFYGIETLNSKL